MSSKEEEDSEYLYSSTSEAFEEKELSDDEISADIDDMFDQVVNQNYEGLDDSYERYQRKNVKNVRFADPDRSISLLKETNEARESEHFKICVFCTKRLRLIDCIVNKCEETVVTPNEVQEYWDMIEKIIETCRTCHKNIIIREVGKVQEVDSQRNSGKTTSPQLKIKQI